MRILVLGGTVHDETYKEQDLGESNNSDDEIITAINELNPARDALR